MNFVKSAISVSYKCELCVHIKEETKSVTFPIFVLVDDFEKH